ncbi:MAG: hypothetical protein A2161_22350 [Candidatus Schekmanbacteria bacterium RBG_13_48_7]|uniref:Uncharacterized protein n=1 Tax=Candidatus Schekmanbacteria bacterium RBG_13_48_7 TaxID=1817878 RepID=A0A1F7RYM4_9BACT|nr:MAG: hypothetical protein A2161_22350 [Candidatus Schekmanbacteria bacterium RBG_13_48_7]
MNEEIFKQLSKIGKKKDNSTDQPVKKQNDNAKIDPEKGTFVLKESELQTDKEITNIIFLLEQNRSKALSLLKTAYQRYPNNQKISKLFEKYFPESDKKLPIGPSYVQQTSESIEEASKSDNADKNLPFTSEEFIKLNLNQEDQPISSDQIIHMQHEDNFSIPVPEVTEIVKPSKPVMDSTSESQESQKKTKLSRPAKSYAVHEPLISIKLIFISLIIVIVAMTAYHYLKGYRDYKFKIQAAEDLMSSGHYTSALRSWELLIDDYPDDTWLKQQMDSTKAVIQKQKTEKNIKEYTRLGAQFFNEGSYSGAINFFLKALEIDPENAEIQSYLEEANKRQKEYVEFQQTEVEKRKKKIEELSSKAKEYMDEGKLDSARELFLRILMIDANHSEATTSINEIDFLKSSGSSVDVQPKETLVPESYQDREIKGLLYYQQQIGNYKNLLDLAQQRLNKIKEGLFSPELTELQKEKLFIEQKELLHSMEEFHGKIWDLKMKALAEDIPLDQLR